MSILEHQYKAEKCKEGNENRDRSSSHSEVIAVYFLPCICVSCTILYPLDIVA